MKPKKRRRRAKRMPVVAAAPTPRDVVIHIRLSVPATTKLVELGVIRQAIEESPCVSHFSMHFPLA